MNMISTAFPIETDATSQQDKLVSKLVTAWEKKNSKAARAGGLSLMALSLAACGAEDETAFTQADIDAAVAAVDITSDNAAASATAVATAVAAVDITSDNAAAVATAVAAVDIASDNAAAVTLALRNAAAEAGAVTFDGQSNAALISAIKTADNAGLADAAVAALNITGVSTLAGLNTAYDTLANPTVTAFTLTSTVATSNGSASDDSFSGVIVGANATGTTLNAGDVLNGGAGTDSMTLSVSGNSGGTLSILGVQATGLENFLVSNFDTNAAAITVDATLMTGLAKVGFKASSSTGGLVFDNVGNIVDVELSSGTADFTLTYTAAAKVGTNVQDVALMNQTAGALSIAGVETVNISSTLANNTLADLIIANASSLNITGDKNLTITADTDFADVTSGTAVDGTVDASAFTGNLSMEANANDVIKITGGSGADTFEMKGGFDINDDIDGGAGIDTISMTAVANSATTTLSTFGTSNVEKFSIAGVDEASHTVSALGVSALTHVVLVENADGGDNNGDDYTVTNLSSGATVVAQNSVNARDMNTITLSLADASGTSDSITVEMNGTSGHLAADNSINDLNVQDIETLNLVSGQTGTTAMLSTDDNTLDDLSSDSTLTTLNISGTAESNITIGTEATKLATIDASAMAVASTITVAATADQSITGGTAVDTIIMASTLNNADTIDGGAGLDVLTATSTTFTATTGALAVSNVETINLTNGGTSVINAAGITGATEIAVLTNTTSTTITNLAAGTKVGLGHNNTDGASTGLLNVSLADATGTSDALTINLNNTLAGATTAELKATGIETVTIDYTDDTDTSNADYTLDVDSINATTLVLTGGTLDVGNATTLTVLDSDTTTLDASGFGGILTMATATATATAVTVAGDRVHDLTGSSGADTFTVGNTTGSALTIAGGGGIDTLNMTLGNGVQDFDLMSTIENINFTIGANADITTSADADVLDGINTATNVTFTGGNSLSSVTLGAGTTGLTGDGKAVNSIFDFSGFSGTISNATFDQDVFDNDTTGITVQVIGTANAGDKVTTSYIGSASAAAQINMQGVETFDIDLANNGTEVVLDMSLVTGLTEVNVTDHSSEDIDFNNLAAGVTIDFTTDNTTASNLEIRQAVTSGTESQTIKVKAVGADDALDVVMADIETLTVKADSAIRVDLDLGSVSMTAAGAVSTLNFTGANDILISGMNADITTVDASGMATGGSVVQTGRSATAASTVTGSNGADTFMHLNGGDAISGGVGVDTLDINKAAILGGINVDLSSTTAQVTTYNGGVAAGAVTGFENADLEGYTGFGAQVTGSTGANIVHGTAIADEVNLGAGNDTFVLWDLTDDTVDAGAGTGDALAMRGGVDIAATDDMGTYTNFETLSVEAASTTAFSVIAKADFKSDTGIATVDFSADTNATGNNVIDFGLVDATMTITGGSGKETISGSDEDFDMVITGGAGNDVLESTAAANSDVFVFAATGALNGKDTITGVGTTGKDIFDVSAFLSGGTFNATAIAVGGSADVVMDNKVTMLNGTAAGDIDQVAEIAALIQGAGDALALTSGAKGIIMAGDASGVNDIMNIFFVDDSVGATAGTISADDVVLVATFSTFNSVKFDLDTLAANNFDFIV